MYSEVLMERTINNQNYLWQNGCSEMTHLATTKTKSYIMSQVVIMKRHLINDQIAFVKIWSIKLSSYWTQTVSYKPWFMAERLVSTNIETLEMSHEWQDSLWQSCWRSCCLQWDANPPWKFSQIHLRCHNFGDSCGHAPTLLKFVTMKQAGRNEIP